MPAKLKFEKGHRFVGTRITYLSDADSIRSPNGKLVRVIRCLCDCGVEFDQRLNQLADARVKSCGCSFQSHNESGTPMYRLWVSMRQRVRSCPQYISKNIAVCSEWEIYENFKKWCNDNGFSQSLTLERKDNTLDYCPENCVFADRKTQAQNTSISKRWYIEGVWYNSKSDAARAHNVAESTIVYWCDVIICINIKSIS